MGRPEGESPLGKASALECGNELLKNHKILGIYFIAEDLRASQKEILLHRVRFHSEDTAIIWYLHLTIRAHRISPDDSKLRTGGGSFCGQRER